MPKRTRTEHRKRDPQSIINTLLHIRRECLRGEREGLEHAEALLRVYGVDPSEHFAVKARPRRFARGEIRQIALDMLREGPITTQELADKLQGATA